MGDETEDDYGDYEAYGVIECEARHTVEYHFPVSGPIEFIRFVYYLLKHWVMGHKISW